MTDPDITEGRLDRSGQGEVPDLSIIEFVRESGLVGREGSVSFRPLTGGVSSDIWLVTTGNQGFCVKRALPFLRVAAEWQAPGGCPV